MKNKELVVSDTTLKVKISNELVLEVQPNEEHEWLLSNKDVAEGYGLTPDGIRMTKRRHIDELEEGKHFITVANCYAQKISKNSKARQVIMWTKQGVVRLGFLIKTPLAKQFRDWAEDFIIKKSEENILTASSTYIEALKAQIELVKQLEENNMKNPKAEIYN